jgi:small-conductance mechanosensitive channel
MSGVSSDRPRAISRMFPKAPTLEALFDASQAQARQLFAILEANKNRVHQERESRERFAELTRSLQAELDKLEGSILGVRAKLHEFELKQATKEVPDAYEKGATKAKWTLLAALGMAAMAFLSAVLTRLIFK